MICGDALLSACCSARVGSSRLSRTSMSARLTLRSASTSRSSTPKSGRSAMLRHLSPRRRGYALYQCSSRVLFLFFFVVSFFFLYVVWCGMVCVCVFSFFCYRRFFPCLPFFFYFFVLLICFVFPFCFLMRSDMFCFIYVTWSCRN